MGFIFCDLISVLKWSLLPWFSKYMQKCKIFLRHFFFPIEVWELLRLGFFLFGFFVGLFWFNGLSLAKVKYLRYGTSWLTLLLPLSFYRKCAITSCRKIWSVVKMHFYCLIIRKEECGTPFQIHVETSSQTIHFNFEFEMQRINILSIEVLKIYHVWYTWYCA